jgi:hypothetical protein
MRMRRHTRPPDSPPFAVTTALLLCLLTLVAGCTRSTGSDVEAAQKRVTNAQSAVADASAALQQSNTAFCAAAKDYITAIDRYGKVFDEQAATVGDVKTLGSDLAQPRESTTAAARAVLDAHDALNAATKELADAKAALAVANASASGSRWPG